MLIKNYLNENKKEEAFNKLSSFVREVFREKTQELKNNVDKDMYNYYMLYVENGVVNTLIDKDTDKVYMTDISNYIGTLVSALNYVTLMNEDNPDEPLRDGLIDLVYTMFSEYLFEEDFFGFLTEPNLQGRIFESISGIESGEWSMSSLDNFSTNEFKECLKEIYIYLLEDKLVKNN